MSGIAVITDSACDLAPEELGRLGVVAIPLTVSFGQEAFMDGVDLSRDEFYTLLMSSKEPAKTAQPSPGAFAAAYDQVLRTKDQVLVICLSAGLSGTYESAFLARTGAKDPERITVFDSRAASIGQALMVIEAAERVKAGQSMEAILAYLEDFRDRLASLFTLDTLEYLVRGGRLGRAQGMVGAMLNIKPILQLDRDGRIVPREKVRGRKQAIERLMEIVAGESRNLPGQRVGICHSRAAGEASELARLMKGRFKVGEIVIGEISATIGSHVGPGCLAVFFQR